MKRFSKILALILVVLFVLLYCLLFTQTGNDIVKPIIESKAKETSGLDIKIDKFSLRFNSIDIETTLMEEVKGKVFGELNLFKRSFDINYSISADKLHKIEGVKIDEPLKLYGNIVGDMKKINASGEGDVFGSALHFNAVLLDFKPSKANANAKNLHLAKILAVLGQPIYSDGVIDLDIDINPNQRGELGGNALISLNNGIIYKDTLRKEFNLTLSKNVVYKAAANFAMDENSVLVGKTDLITSLANLKSVNTRYNLSDLSVSSDFKLDIPNLKEFEGLAGIPLSGALNLYGDIKYDKSLQAIAKSDNFAGGKLEVSLDGDKLIASLSTVKIEEVLKMLVQPNYAGASLNVRANFNSIAAKNGQIDVDVINGVLNSDTLKKEFNLTLPKTNFNAKSNVALKNNTADFKVKFLSDLVNLEKLDGSFDIDKNELKSSYLIDSKNLSKLSAISGQKISGALNVYGDVNYAKDSLRATAKSDNIAGGKLDFSLDNDKLIANLVNIKLEELLTIAAQPNYASGILNLKADLTSISNKDGKIDIDVTKGTLNSDTFKKELNLTLPKSGFSAKANSVIKGGVGNFDAKVLSDLANLSKLVGTFDINKSEFKSDYEFEAKNLSKFNGITKQNMVGSLTMDGIAKYQNNKLYADGKSNILGGNLGFNLNDTKLFLKGDNLSSIEGLEMLSYPAIFDSKIALRVNYDTSNNKGDFNVTSPNGHLSDTQLGALIQAFLDFDITSEEYKDIVLKGKMDGENIDFLFDMQGNKTSISIKNGKIRGKILDIPYKIMVEKTDLPGKITGTTDKPNVSLDTSKYLKSKAVKEIDRQLEKQGKKTLNSILKKL